MNTARYHGLRALAHRAMSEAHSLYAEARAEVGDHDDAAVLRGMASSYAAMAAEAHHRQLRAEEAALVVVGEWAGIPLTVDATD